MTDTTAIKWVCEELAYWIDSAENSMHSDDDDRARVTEGRAAIAAALAPREAEPVELRSSPGSEGLLPCPFCASSSVDPEGWMSCEPDGSNKRTGPACDDCGASAESDERWNTRDWAPDAHAQAVPAPVAWRRKWPLDRDWSYSDTKPEIVTEKLLVEPLYASPISSTDREGK